jgi:IS5 family transposase
MGDETDRRRSNKRTNAAARASNPRSSSPRADAIIAQQLKAMYDEVVAQPVPEHLLALLKRLDDGGAEK